MLAFFVIVLTLSAVFLPYFIYRDYQYIFINARLVMWLIVKEPVRLYITILIQGYHDVLNISPWLSMLTIKA